MPQALDIRTAFKQGFLGLILCANALPALGRADEAVDLSPTSLVDLSPSAEAIATALPLAQTPPEPKGRPRVRPNADGYFSLGLSAYSIPGRPLYRDSYESTYVSPSPSYTDVYSYSSFLELAGGYGGALDLTWPMSSILTLGVQAQGEVAVIDEDHDELRTLYYYPPSYSYLTNTAIDRYTRSWESRSAMLRGKARFHTSGYRWDRSSAEGGSPWGRTWHPVIELVPIAYYGENYGILFTGEGSLQVPVASWLLLSVGYRAANASNLAALSFGDYDYYGYYSSYGSSHDYGGTGKFGMAVAIPLNSAGKRLFVSGMLERPLVLGKNARSLESGRVELGLPVSEWASVQALWEHQSVSDRGNSGSTIETGWDRLGLGLKFHWTPDL